MDSMNGSLKFTKSINCPRLFDEWYEYLDHQNEMGLDGVIDQYDEEEDAE